MTMILAKELRGRDITVNAVAPGPTATPALPRRQAARRRSTGWPPCRPWSGWVGPGHRRRRRVPGGPGPLGQRAGALRQRWHRLTPGDNDRERRNGHGHHHQAHCARHQRLERFRSAHRPRTGRRRAHRIRRCATSSTATSRPPRTPARTRPSTTWSSGRSSWTWSTSSRSTTRLLRSSMTPGGSTCWSTTPATWCSAPPRPGRRTAGRPRPRRPGPDGGRPGRG